MKLHLLSRRPPILESDESVTSQGTIRVPQSTGLGYHVRQDLIERWTVEKQTFRTA